MISIHAPREGCDISKLEAVTAGRYFNPRTPRGVRPGVVGVQPKPAAISIHAPREGCDLFKHATERDIVYISIHAPREGCDRSTTVLSPAAGNFNPRTPRGVRPLVLLLGQGLSIFQSTHPARGATATTSLSPSNPRQFQSTHPARGATVCWHYAYFVFGNFNPRTPRGVRPTRSTIKLLLATNFNPRTPRGVRPAPLIFPFQPQEISIHAPREGCDWRSQYLSHESVDFNPRTPRGVRHQPRLPVQFHSTFQSTHPARGATAVALIAAPTSSISIHAPREGCDLAVFSHKISPFYFNPRTPRGVRLATLLECEEEDHISIHAPREGCDMMVIFNSPLISISIHAPREGCDGDHNADHKAMLNISIHAPREGCDRDRF